MIKKIKILLISILLITIASCSSKKVKVDVNDELLENANNTEEVVLNIQEDTSTPTVSPTSTPFFTPTPDNRMLPEEWMNWPVTPLISGTVIDIFAKGQSLGRNPDSFSKIGDCQNVKEAFLGFFDRETVPLTEATVHLQDTIDNFKGLFNRDGFAVEGGLIAPSSLNSLFSDPQNCQLNENPIQCEIRINNPAYAFVSFEFWYKGRSAENYEGYLRQVVELLIEQGVIPILLTKADNVEGDHSLNYTIAKIAYEYDIPLVNWWKTAQSLPNRGMDPERNDGFHTSPISWTERSYDALDMLDYIWKTLTK